MPKYNVDRVFWRRGREVTVGEKIYMTEAEAKYLGHVISEDKPAAPEVAAAPAEVTATEVAKPIAAEVSEEQPVRHGKRHKRGAEHGGA